MSPWKAGRDLVALAREHNQRWEWRMIGGPPPRKVTIGTRRSKGKKALDAELVINLKTAKSLGLTIPEPFLQTADEVIE